MYPTLLTIGSFELTSFGGVVAIAFLVAGAVLRHEAQRLALPPEVPDRMIVAAIIGGLLGAKAYFLLLHAGATVADPWRAIMSRGGLVWYGGLIGATTAVVATLRRAKAPLGRAADAAAPALALGYAVGRIGCFLVGDDYGRPTTLPWGVAFREGPTPSTVANLAADYSELIPAGLAGDFVLRVHPTQLYEAGLMSLVFLTLHRLRTDPRLVGRLFGLYLVLAGAERLWVEFLRAKDDRLLAAFTVAQLISLIAIAVGVAWLWQGLRSVPRPSIAAAIEQRP